MSPWLILVAVGVGALWLGSSSSASASTLPPGPQPIPPPAPLPPVYPPAVYPTLPYTQQGGTLGPGSTIHWVGTYSGHDIYEDQSGMQWIMDAGGHWVVSPYPDPTEIPDTAPTH